jgi:hypothetical protein
VPGLLALVALGVTALSGTTLSGAAAARPATSTVADRAGTPARAAEPSPLQLHLDEMTPVVPRKGRVTFAGTISNDSLETWTDIYVMSFRSSAPILDSPSLAQSATIEEDAYVGDRITDTYDLIPSLAPGESTRFRLRVPVEQLGLTEPGIYWTGVHASGISSAPRDDFADGRARTFVPVVPETGRPVDTAIVLPLRGTAWYDATGRLTGLDRWLRQLSDGGRLDRVLDMAEAADGIDFTWLVDPAVLDAVTRLAAGNPRRSLDPDPTVPGQEPSATESPDGEGNDSGEDGDSADESPAPSTPADVPADERSEDEQEVAELAMEWLTRAGPLLSDHQVLALPYGDIDVSAAARRGPDLLEEARLRSEQVMTELGIASSPAVAPEDGLLSPGGLSALPASTTVLMADTAFTAPPTSASSMIRILEHEVVVTSSGARSGGPVTTAAGDPLGMRQRLLSEAALRVVDGSRAPLVVTLPTRWQPEDPESFFGALSRGWLRPVELRDVKEGVASASEPIALAYSDDDAADELGPAAFTTARAAREAASVLEQVLTLQTTVETQVTDEVLSTLSVQHRRSPKAALSRTVRLVERLEEELDLIEVQAPRAVTLTSDSGPLGLTLVNRLDQPVTVDLLVTSDGRLEVTGQGTHELAPRSRTQVRLIASTDRSGIHQVTARVTTTAGTPVGRPVSLPIRSSQVSEVIWWIMGGGAAILVAAIVVRLWRRVRRARSAARGEAA